MMKQFLTILFVVATAVACSSSSSGTDVKPCPNGYMDCDLDPSTGVNGCEATLSRTGSTENCGKCGNTCTGGTVCGPSPSGGEYVCSAPCNTIANIGSPVPPTATPGSSPSPGSISIGSGTYVATEWRVYGGYAPKGTLKSTFEISPGSGAFALVVASGDPVSEERWSGKFGNTGGGFQIECPKGSTAASFVVLEANATSLTLKASTDERQVLVFTKH